MSYPAYRVTAATTTWPAPSWIRAGAHSFEAKAFNIVVSGFLDAAARETLATLSPDAVLVQALTAPPTWPKPGKGHDDPSATINWIKSTWPAAG